MSSFTYREYKNTAKPRNGALLDGVQTTSYSSGGSGGSTAELYWKLITTDASGNALTNPYILTTYPAASEGNITAYITNDSDIVLPIASASALGAIKVGSNLTITSDGTLNANAGTTYTLPAATTSTLGGIIVGSNLTITSAGVLSASAGSTYTLPTASSSTLGGIKVGSNLTISSGVLSAVVPTSMAWSSITGKPTYYQTSYNGYIDNLPDYFPTYWSSTYITGLPSTFTPSAHTHVTSDISDRTSYIDLLANSQTLTGQKTFTQTIIGQADVIAYSTGGSTSAAFKYWYPSVSSDGTLSWTNSTSESTPTSVNIKGPASTWNGGTVTATTTFQAGVTISGYTYPFLAFKDSNASSTSYIEGRSDSSIYFCFGSTSSNKASISSTGAMYIAGSLTQNSDIRLKNRGDSVTGILDAIDGIDAFRFSFKDDSGSEQHIGVSAQDVMKYFPELVAAHTIGDDTTEYYAVDYSTLATVVAVNGAKEIMNIISDLQERIKILESK